MIILPVIVFLAIFTVFSGATSLIWNIALPDAIIYLNIAVPVLAGYFYGPRTGVFVGIIGPLLVWKIPYFGSDWYLPAIVGFGVAGFLAGYLGRYKSEVLAAFSIPLGYLITYIIRALTSGIILGKPVDVQFLIKYLLAEAMIAITLVLVFAIPLQDHLFKEKRF